MPHQQQSPVCLARLFVHSQDAGAAAEGACWRRYGCTKWATEVQLQQLHREYGVPVSVFRCGMILAHSR